MSDTANRGQGPGARGQGPDPTPPSPIPPRSGAPAPDPRPLAPVLACVIALCLIACTLTFLLPADSLIVDLVYQGF